MVNDFPRHHFLFFSSRSGYESPIRTKRTEPEPEQIETEEQDGDDEQIGEPNTEAEEATGGER
jgi:hypothetical protein